MTRLESITRGAIVRGILVAMAERGRERDTPKAFFS